MEWWRKAVVSPVRRALVVLAARMRRRRKKHDVLVKLHDEIKTCGYEDVQVMWEMLQRSSDTAAAGKLAVAACEPTPPKIAAASVDPAVCTAESSSSRCKHSLIDR